MTPRYRTIVVDPPWAYPDGFKKTLATGRDHNITPGPMVRVELPYSSMTISDIKALPVSGLADPGGCRLWLWTTNAYLRSAFDVMEAWGFDYGQTLVWHKTGCTPWPTSVAPNSAEFILTGTIGTPGRFTTWNSAVITHSVPKRHSAKPELFTYLIEQASPAPRLELFARRNRLGWDTWGDEALGHVEVGGSA